MEEMRDKVVNQKQPNAFVCFNKECVFYGIERITKEWFFDV